MAKYDEQFKRRAVEIYLSGKDGFRAVAEQLGTSRTVLRRWVEAYRQHGRAGLRKKHSRYDAQFKLDVLNRMWTQGLSREQVAAIFEIRNPPCIGQWERRYHSGGIDALAPRRQGRPKAMQPPDKPRSTKDLPREDRTREQLLKENQSLRAEVAYLKKLDALVQAKQKAAQRKKRK